MNLVYRPYLVSQTFGSSDLRKHIDDEILAVELNPFKYRVEAKPDPPLTTLFSGIMLAIFHVRPPSSRAAPDDMLAVEFHFTTRPGSVAVQVGQGTDFVTVAVVLNDAQYSSPALTPRHDRFVNPKDLEKAQPDFLVNRQH